jgi:2'-5' RNA ligase
MPRVRLASALLVPEPFATEIDGLRRALGESLERVPPHITLVPPVNVRVEDLGAVFALLRSSSAAATESFTVTVGPAVTFHPVNPVVYLAVTGDGVDELRALRERVCTGPFGRPLTYDFVPHVTVVEHTTPDRIEAAMVALADYRVDVTFESAFVLQQREHGHGLDARRPRGARVPRAGHRAARGGRVRRRPARGPRRCRRTRDRRRVRALRGRPRPRTPPARGRAPRLNRSLLARARMPRIVGGNHGARAGALHKRPTLIRLQVVVVLAERIAFLQSSVFRLSVLDPMVDLDTGATAAFDGAQRLLPQQRHLLRN